MTTDKNLMRAERVVIDYNTQARSGWILRDYIAEALREAVATERRRCAGVDCLLCRRGVAIEASDEGYGHILSGRWHACKASRIWDADQPGAETPGGDR